jgi:K+-transporting ATPase ATPase C chain
MNSNVGKISIPRQVVMSGRIVLTTMFVCCVLYTLTILVIGQILVPYTANGSILQNEYGDIIGSEAVAQAFTRPEYFWPRPSSVDYNASAAGGSNWSPTNPELSDRAEMIIDRLGLKEGILIPADMVTASGSGLDPDITLKSANYQVARVARARGISVLLVQVLLDRHAVRTGGFLTPEPLVNVLSVNRALDQLEE